MDNSKITEELRNLAEPKYKDFMAKLLPTVSKEKILGVRVGALRSIAKNIVRTEDAESFISNLPHNYYEENYIHALVLSMLEYERCVSGIKAFLPFVDNWGVCDGLRPKCFSDNKEKLIGEIFSWIESEHTYTVRFAIEMLMLHFLGESFLPEYHEAVSKVRSGEYYLDMMVAWYFASALAERCEETLPYLTEKRLATWVHNKTISKAIESYRISNDKKEYLKALRIKGKASE